LNERAGGFSLFLRGSISIEKERKERGKKSVRERGKKKERGKK